MKDGNQIAKVLRFRVLLGMLLYLKFFENPNILESNNKSVSRRAGKLVAKD